MPGAEGAEDELACEKDCGLEEAGTKRRDWEASAGASVSAARETEGWRGDWLTILAACCAEGSQGRLNLEACWTSEKRKIEPLAVVRTEVRES